MFSEPVRMAQPHQYLSPRCTKSSLINDVGTVSSICLYTLYKSYKTRVSTLMSASSALLGAFEKLRKGTISFVMHVRSKGTRLPLDRFSWNLIFEIFRKSVEKIQVSLKSDKNKGYFTWRPIYIFYDISLISSYSEMFRTKVVEKIKTHILCSVTFFPKIVPFMRKRGENTVERRRPQMTIWRMRIACWMLKATNTLRLCNTHCFSTAIMVARTRLNVT